MALPINFTWFGLLTTRFDFSLHRHAQPVAELVTGKSLPAGFKLLAIPPSIETGTGYSIRLSSTDRPEVFTDSAEFEVIEPTGPPSEFSFGAATVTVNITSRSTGGGGGGNGNGGGAFDLVALAIGALLAGLSAFRARNRQLQ